MVFSSSCTVYGEPERVPIDETVSRSAVSPYGNTKLVIEDIMTGISFFQSLAAYFHIRISMHSEMSSSTGDQYPAILFYFNSCF